MRITRGIQINYFISQVINSAFRKCALEDYKKKSIYFVAAGL